jgi:hypothetical protein
MQQYFPEEQFIEQADLARETNEDRTVPENSSVHLPYAPGPGTQTVNGNYAPDDEEDEDEVEDDLILGDEDELEGDEEEFEVELEEDMDEADIDEDDLVLDTDDPVDDAEEDDDL